MTTVHADDPTSALNSRMVSFLMRSGAGFSEETARLEVATAFNLVVHIARTFAGQRYVAAISLVDPTFITNRIDPLTLFEGHQDISGSATSTSGASYSRVSALPPSTKLAQKFVEAGIDASRWLAPVHHTA
jgi:hypothetical protein